jgi:GT2 family glycosyltransferase
MKILVIIATYNAMQWAERCFNSIRSSSVTPDVFVVDNGSTDGTQAFIQAHYPEIMFQQSHENLGFGRANNLGLQYALDHHYDYVYLLNQDAWIFPDTLETLIDISRRHPEYGIISPFQMKADLYHYSTYSWSSNKDILNDMYNCNMADLYPVDFAPAAHWLIPCSVLKMVGGFSPSFQHYGEDNNYVHRVRWKKMKIGIAPKVKVVHDRGGREYSRKEELSLQYSNNIVLLSNPYVSVPYSSFKVLQ